MTGTWQPKQPRPSFWPGEMFLLTDGSVFCHEWQTLRWWRLWPDSSGSYFTNHWQPAASMHDLRIFSGGTMMADGRVLIAGGYWVANNNTFPPVTTIEIYDPLADTWSKFDGPPKLLDDKTICSAIGDGRILVASPTTTDCGVYDPMMGNWVQAGQGKSWSAIDEIWALLPDGDMFANKSIQPKFQSSESYIPGQGKWVVTATAPVDLTGSPFFGSQSGTGVLLTDGRVFFVGASGHTAFYRPAPNVNAPGTWDVGPDLPLNSHGHPMRAWDSPIVLLPNGNVLFQAYAQEWGNGGWSGDQEHFFEFNLQTEFPELVDVSLPVEPGLQRTEFRMLLLPTGQVLLMAAGETPQHKAVWENWIYTPDGAPFDSWRPKITLHPSSIQAGSIYPLRGQQINGLSQAVCHGDFVSGATNYPLVRLHQASSGKVWYCPTAGHSSMAVATGTAVNSTTFLVPNGVALGKLDLSVVANGIESAPVTVQMKPSRPPFMVDGGLVNQLVGSLADGPLWALGPNGPVPIGPFNGRLRGEAVRATQSIVEGLRQLQHVGQEVLAKRAEAAAAHPGPTRFLGKPANMPGRTLPSLSR